MNFLRTIVNVVSDIVDKEEKEAGALLIEEIEEVKIDLLREKEIIRIGAKITEPKKTADLLILKKSLMEKKKVSKKGFLIKKKDFLVKKNFLETNLS